MRMAPAVGARRFTPASRMRAGRSRLHARALARDRLDRRLPSVRARMAGAIEAARALAGDLQGLGKPLDIGVDGDARGARRRSARPGAARAAETRKLMRTAEALDLARVSNHGAIVIERRPPRVAFGDALVTLPPGGFLQATRGRRGRGSRRSPSEALRGAKRVADLFCGAGAFALAARPPAHEVFAADSDAAAIAALARAAATAPRPAQTSRGDARSLPPPAAGRRTRRFRRARCSIRRAPARSRPGARDRRERPAARRLDLLQRDDLRPRRAHSDRGGFRHRDGRRRLTSSAFRPCRNRRRLSPAARESARDGGCSGEREREAAARRPAENRRRAAMC